METWHVYHCGFWSSWEEEGEVEEPCIYFYICKLQFGSVWGQLVGKNLPICVLPMDIKAGNLNLSIEP